MRWPDNNRRRQFRHYPNSTYLNDIIFISAANKTADASAASSGPGVLKPMRDPDDPLAAGQDDAEAKQLADYFEKLVPKLFACPAILTRIIISSDHFSKYIYVYTHTFIVQEIRRCRWWEEKEGQKA